MRAQRVARDGWGLRREFFPAGTLAAMSRRFPLSMTFPLGLAALAMAFPACGARSRVPTSAPTVSGQSPGSARPAEVGESDLLDMLEHRVAEAIDRVRQSAVALEYTAADAPSGTRRAASGVVISNEGEILSVRIDAPTATSPIRARVASGRWLPAHWVASDPETGLTLLKIEPGLARPAVPSSREARLGIPVLMIGNPFGLGHSVNRGFIAGIDRRLELGLRQLGGLIQVDASLHPGDSGALLADLHGGWLGVIRSGLASPVEGDRRGREHDHDLGFAIPAADALWVASQLRAARQVDRAYLGVTMDHAAPLPPEGPLGAVLGRVLADTPAERAGLKSGDRVVAIDGRPVRSPYDLTDRLDRTPADSEITLDLVPAAAPSVGNARLTLRTARRPPFEPSRRSSPLVKSRGEDSPPTLSREVAERIKRLDRRIDELEKQKPDVTQAQKR
ncbi:MAG: hypothetical protein NVSMB9_25160 [Isosphaeraceae bacterium]